MQRVLFVTLRIVMVGIGLIVAMSFGISTVEPMPKNAIVIVDEDAQVYFSPSYFKDNAINIPSAYKYLRVGEVHSGKYKPDAKCRDQGYFLGEDESLFRSLLKKVGLLERKNRWNSDGSWNW